MRRCEFKVDAFPGRVVWLVGLSLLAPLLAHAEQLPIRTYTAADGLGSSYVIHIMRDSRGFMWFCTRNGLSRFDGQRFFTYTTKHGLPSATINHIIETRGGDYWVATNGGGVCRFNPAASLAAPNGTPVFTTYPVGETKLTNNVNFLYEDRAGRIWAGTDDGLFRLAEAQEGGGFRRVELAMLPPSGRGVSSLLEDGDGHLWIGSDWGLVRRLPDGQLIHYALRPSAAGDVVNSLLVDNDGRLWVGHREGLLVFTPEPAAQLRTAEAEPWRSFRNPQSAIRNGAGTPPPTGWPVIR